MRRPGALVFDLDGTLIDSRVDIATAVNRTRADFRLAPLSLEEIVAMVGEGARALVERALGDAAGFELDEALARYLAHYGEVCLDTTHAYSGVGEMLDELSGRLPLALLSNKPEAMSRRLLDALGLARYFREVLGGDTLPSRKPDPAGLILLAARFGIPVADLLLIGDSPIDAATAAAAGCPFAQVDWGFTYLQAPASPPALRLARPGDLTKAFLAL